MSPALSSPSSTQPLLLLKALHSYVQSLVNLFLSQLSLRKAKLIGPHTLLERERRSRFPQSASNAVVFDGGTEHAEGLVNCLRKSHGIAVDCRKKQFVRIGFGVEHGPSQVLKLVEAITAAETQIL